MDGDGRVRIGFPSVNCLFPPGWIPPRKVLLSGIGTFNPLKFNPSQAQLISVGLLLFLA